MEIVAVGKALRLCPILSASNPYLLSRHRQRIFWATHLSSALNSNKFMRKRLSPHADPKRGPVTSKKTSRGGEVRIIAGKWRSRKLGFPDAPGLRPTPDRVRETLFNWLGHDLSGFRCLDLYAGSGALGFEALSRGAESVVMVERNFQAVRALEQNAAILAAEGLRIVQADALEFLRRSSQMGFQAEPRSNVVEQGPNGARFDVIFLDPPFSDGVTQEVLQCLPPLLATGAWVYIESGSLSPLIAPQWHVDKQSRAGQVHFQLMRWEPA
jgi:16S rRNA (guanine966-N2)-methyltransferase